MREASDGAREPKGLVVERERRLGRRLETTKTKATRARVKVEMI